MKLINASLGACPHELWCNHIKSLDNSFLNVKVSPIDERIQSLSFVFELTLSKASLNCVGLGWSGNVIDRKDVQSHHLCFYCQHAVNSESIHEESKRLLTHRLAHLYQKLEKEFLVHGRVIDLIRDHSSRGIDCNYRRSVCSVVIHLIGL